MTPLKTFVTLAVPSFLLVLLLVGSNLTSAACTAKRAGVDIAGVVVGDVAVKFDHLQRSNPKVKTRQSNYLGESIMNKDKSTAHVDYHGFTMVLLPKYHFIYIKYVLLSLIL
jgi:hypothetical protein